ncbi:MAG: hypothetical protein M3067_10145 [Chloroflexota bacterium]|nr:hypothetical protein [Chloroflexota bacterium]
MDPKSELLLANIRIAKLHRDAADHRLVATSRQFAPAQVSLRAILRAATAAASTVVAHAR